MFPLRNLTEEPVCGITEVLLVVAFYFILEFRTRMNMEPHSRPSDKERR